MVSSGCISFDAQEKESTGEYDFYVSTIFSSDTPGWNQTCFASIGMVMNQISDNQRIFVYNGTYNENIVINKDNLVLMGEDPLTTIIQGISGDDVILIYKEGQKISGFTISGATEKDNDNPAGVDIRSKGNTITNIIFSNNRFGLYGAYSDENIIQKNLFVNNTEYGAYITTGSNDNVFSDNIFMKSMYALRIKGSDGNEVIKNMFANNTNGLYLCCGTKYSIIYNNVFCNNSGWDAHDTASNNWDSFIPSSWRYYDVSERNYFRGLPRRGNYWERFQNQSHGAYDNNSDGVFDTLYDIPEVTAHDNYPLTDRPTIENPFLDRIDLFSYTN